MLTRGSATVACVIALSSAVAAPGAFGAVSSNGSSGLLAPTASRNDEGEHPTDKLRRALRRELSDPAVGDQTSVYVRDLTARRAAFKSEWRTPRVLASNTKLFSTSAALDRYGTDAALTTSVAGVGSVDASGAFGGDLYLRGGGDPTFGNAAFSAVRNGGSGADVERLADEIAADGVRA
jgi:D-alanyl-D-alanine carboxypeptidase/D-alanyl-D-alanine-endopeptidase (penicillin-binding protein 4)